MPDDIKAYICENNHASSAYGRFPGGEKHCLECGAKVWRVEEFLAIAKIPSPSPASEQLREARVATILAQGSPPHEGYRDWAKRVIAACSDKRGTYNA
jgi:hypothetical protein